MSARRISIVVLMLMAAVGAAAAQGFAGLGQDAEGYGTVTPGREFSFPADHGPHPGHRIEWWYVTANLKGEDGRDYGVQWTLFRQALAPGPEQEGWASQQLWMGHAGLTTPDAHYSAERFARGGIGQAGVKIEPFAAWIDDWSMATGAIEADPLSSLAISAGGDDFAYELSLTTDAQPVLQGEAGYSVKSEAGQASYYYSQPFFEVAGRLMVEGEDVAVSGKAWLDREWSSQPLASDQEGWDWFSLHLPQGQKMMLFRLRSSDGTAFYSGTWIEADGRSRPIVRTDITLEPTGTAEVAGRQVPVEWRIQVPSRGIDLVAAALNPQSWMATTFAYWEGPIRFSGTHDGVGYLEMTGYADSNGN